MPIINKYQINDRYIELVKNKVINPRVKIELLDNQENVIDEITEYVLEDSGTININYNQGVRRTVSLTIENSKGNFTPSYKSNFFWSNRKFKLSVGLYDAKIDDTYWIPQGIFVVTNPEAVHDPQQKVLNISGVDKFGWLGSETGYSVTDSTHLIRAGTDALSAIKDILLLDMGNNTVIDSKPPILDPKFQSYVLPYDIRKSPSGYYGDIIVEIANVLAADIYYNTEGHLVLQAGTDDITGYDKPVIWHFAEDELEYMGSNLTFDFTKVANIIHVVSENTDGKIYTAKAENNNPQSPTRIELIGKKTKVVNDNLIYNDARCQDRAIYELNNLTILQQLLKMKSTYIPHLDVNEVITIENSFYGWIDEKFLIQSISMPLSGIGNISIDCANVRELPFYDTK